MTVEDPQAIRRRSVSFVEDHRDLYLSSGGAQGHIKDMTAVGVPQMLATLLLKTIGRKSGNELIVPLSYGCYGGDWVIVASRAGAPTHPAWFLNLQSREEAQFQIATQAFKGSWRTAEGAERQDVWSYIVHHNPTYGGYQQSAGDRIIPLVLLRPRTEIPVFRPK